LNKGVFHDAAAGNDDQLSLPFIFAAVDSNGTHALSTELEDFAITINDDEPIFISADDVAGVQERPISCNNPINCASRSSTQPIDLFYGADSGELIFTLSSLNALEARNIFDQQGGEELTYSFSLTDPSLLTATRVNHLGETVDAFTIEFDSANKEFTLTLVSERNEADTGFIHSRIDHGPFLATEFPFSVPFSIEDADGDLAEGIINLNISELSGGV